MPQHNEGRVGRAGRFISNRTAPRREKERESIHDLRHNTTRSSRGSLRLAFRGPNSVRLLNRPNRYSFLVFDTVVTRKCQDVHKTCAIPPPNRAKNPVPEEISPSSHNMAIVCDNAKHTHRSKELTLIPLGHQPLNFTLVLAVGNRPALVVLSPTNPDTE